MLLAYLEAFVEIARNGTIRRAGDVLHVGQPALSARIAALEDEIGVRLFDRTPKGMLLTAPGRALLPHAERALASVSAGIGHARAADRGKAEQIVLGAAPAVSAYVLPELIARLRELRPNLRALVRTGHSEEIVALVAAGDVQLGLVRELRDSRLVTHPLFEDELVLVVRPDHPFAAEGRIGVERLREAVLIFFDRTSSYYDLTHTLFRGAGVVPGGTMEVDNIETAKRMTARGLGVSFLPSTSVADAIGDGSLVWVRVFGIVPVRRHIAAIERAGSPTLAPPELWQLLRAIPDFIAGARPIVHEE
jgi:DNA-binding transcriptional LysR family regulator